MPDGVNDLIASRQLAPQALLVRQGFYRAGLSEITLYSKNEDTYSYVHLSIK